MDNFIVSARKYRPTTFDSVVGQLSITSTLKNAIKNNQLAQAFLFCGPRGVGKTTCARILAKTINCFNITDNIEACNTCDSCVSFDQGRSLNIYELDAASNNSVDDIRNLIEQVRFSPQIGTHKIYIIDEVHMLSQAAFNAFLKTLEEPPKHAIFILATTEKHKIIPTILSRCQIFDFNRIMVDDITNHLISIAQQEKLEAEQDGLHIIAQKADGALRDALSMFDQIVSFTEGKISYQNVIDNLNILDYDYYFKVTAFVLERNISGALLLFDEILHNGFDGHNFVNGLSHHFRNLLVALDPSTVPLLEVGDSIKEKYAQQANLLSVEKLMGYLSVTSKTDVQYKTSKNQRLLVEVMLMQLCSEMNDEKKKATFNLPINQSTPTEKVVKATPPPAKEPEPPSVATTKEEPTPQKPVEQEKKLPLKKPAKIDMGISFSDSISIKTQEPKAQNRETEEAEITTSRPRKPFTPEMLDKTWKAYRDVLLEKGKSSLATIFESTPTCEENTLLVVIENKALEDELMTQKAEVLLYLRENLNNYDIQIQTLINKDSKSKKAYTPQEKFNKMSEKNACLNTLVQKLDLDIGYA